MEIQHESESREKVASLVGKDSSQVGVVQLQLERLLTEGILIELDIKGESMFTRLADWSEIGIDVDDIRSNRLTRGQKFLIAESRIKNLRTVTTRMRQWLEKSTNDITGFRPWRYLYYKRYVDWKERWNILTADFESAKQDILDNYDDDKKTLASDFREVAEKSWKSIMACGNKSVLYNSIRYTDFEDFTDAVIATVLATVPTKEQIQAGLKVDYHVSILKGRDQVESEMVKSAKKKAQIDLIDTKKRAKEEVAFSQARILQEEERHLVEMNELAEYEKRVAIDAMIKAEAEHIRQQFAETVAPIEEVFSKVRAEMAEICFEAIESIKKNGHVRGRTADKLHGLVEFYQMTSIQDDPKLLLKLQELKKVIGDVGPARAKDTATREPESVIAALEDVVELKNSIREDLAEVPSRFSFVE